MIFRDKINAHKKNTILIALIFYNKIRKPF